MKPIITVKGIGKKYIINHQRGGYVALRDVIANIFKNPFAHLQTKAKEEFWALKDVNFEVMPGEVIGIIGRNGAGKSTLLKILSQITPPTTGEIRINGTVGSLLEVGTGFHPELTGRENIFLNGAILGMKKSDITKKFDEIVAFSGIDQFLDTPVKYYSSGMYVRLAFSVAAHMDTDILIIDEVLAVGDAEFQKKCLGKMNEITKTEGRTILFVSHNMGAVRQLCKRCILINKGEIEKVDETNSVIDFYSNNGKNLSSIYEYDVDNKKSANITKISIINQNSNPSSEIPISEYFSIKVEYSFNATQKSALLSLLFYSDDELLLLSSESDSALKLENYDKGNYETIIKIPKYLFNVGHYKFDVAIHRPYTEYIDNKTNLHFDITDINNVKSLIFKGYSDGKIASILDYKTKKYEENN